MKKDYIREARVFFFLLWPLFARAPRHWFLENFCCRPRVCKVFFFLLRSVGRRDLSAGPEQKKKHHPGCFFLLRPRGKAREGEAPLGAAFFLLWPRAGAQRGFSFPCLSPGPEQKKKTPWVVFFFLLWPRAGAQRGFSFPCFSPGPQQKKKHPGWCFFFCSGPVPAPNGAAPSLAFRRGRSKKKKHPGWCFFFAAAPRGRSLTHCGPGWRCLPLAGVVFLFFAAAPPGPGWCFFFLLWPRPDAHSLTVGWGDFGKARVVFFFCCGPAGSF